MAERCQHIKSDGNRCGMPAAGGSKFCYRHDPDIPEEEKLAASRKGGLGNRARADVALGKIELKSVHDVLNLLKLVTEEMLNGRLDQRVAATTGYLMNVALRALEGSNLEDRVKKLEDLVQDRISELI